MQLFMAAENLYWAFVRVVFSAERREFCARHGQIEQRILLQSKRGPRNLWSYRHRRRRCGISHIHQYHNGQMVIRKRLQERAEPAPALASVMPEHPMPIERSQSRAQSIVYLRPVGQCGGCTDERQ